MSGLNKVMLIGNLGAAPDVRRTKEGKMLVSMRLATSETWKDKSGTRQERVEWHTVVVFAEGLAKICQQYLDKGSRIYVEGSLQTSKWVDKEGNDRYKTEVVLRPYDGKMVMLSATKSTGAAGSAAPVDIDDEIPF